MKLAVGYPWSSPFVYTEFAEHLPNLERPEGVDVKFFKGKGWCPARRHVDLCEQALDWGADLICIIGADQVHPQDMLPRLYKRFEEGYDIVACLVPSRGYLPWVNMKAFQPMAYRFKTSEETGTTKIRQYRDYTRDSDMLHIIKREDGEMVKCNFCGSGVLMFHIDYLLSLKKPWFFETVETETYERLACMDSTFVWRLQSEAGGTVWIDTTILVEHLHTFHIDDSFQDRFLDWRNEKPNPEIVDNG